MILSIQREELHHRIYLLILTMVVCCLPLSRYLLSISQFLLAINWLIEGRLREKIRIIILKPAILLFASVSLVYAIGLLYSENLTIGIIKIRNALPLLLFPIVVGTSPPLPAKSLKWLLLMFSCAAIAASFLCLLNYQIHGFPSNGDFRNMSIFMLHIRFSLMIIMAIFILLYLAFYNYFESPTHEKISYFLAACLLITFLLFLRSITGILIFVLLITVFIINIAVKSHRPVIRYALPLAALIFWGSLTAVTIITYTKNFHADPIVISTIDSFTANGNPYSQSTQTGALENGHYIGLYLCEPELKQEWNKISQIPYDSVDFKGQPIYETIKRYLTSKGLRKDSAALHKLNQADIQNIEHGLANYKFREDPGVYQRIYEILWEIHIMVRTGFVQQHSFGQRFAFLKAAGYVISAHKWTGVGTGDVYDAMLAVSKSDIPAVDPLWEGKPHNQYAFLILAFGIPGFLWIAWCWLFPAISNKSYRLLLFNLFAGIMLISMFTLDTLESYDNMVFFTFFYCLFVFGIESAKNIKA